MKRFFRLGLILAILVLILYFWQRPDGKLHVIFCDVGQGDSALIVLDSFQMLIDTGPKNGGVVTCLSKHLPFWDRKIEVIVNTHPQMDHMGDMENIVERYQVGQVLNNGRPATGVQIREIMKVLERKKIKVETTRAGDSLRYSSLYFDVIWPDGLEVKENVASDVDENHFAIVLVLKYSDFRALFTADIGEPEELALIDKGVIEKIDVLKVAHHGSKFSSTDKFLEVVRPNWSVISAGKKNSYGHPSPETLKRFDTLGLRLWRTDLKGELEIISDGKVFGMK